MKNEQWGARIFEGSWGMTRRKVDSFGRYFINKIRKYRKSIKDRLYVSEEKNEIQIYFYGREMCGKKIIGLLLKEKIRKM